MAKQKEVLLLHSLQPHTYFLAEWSHCIGQSPSLQSLLCSSQEMLKLHGEAAAGTAPSNQHQGQLLRRFCPRQEVTIVAVLNTCEGQTQRRWSRFACCHSRGLGWDQWFKMARKQVTLGGTSCLTVLTSCDVLNNGKDCLKGIWVFLRWRH